MGKGTKPSKPKPVAKEPSSTGSVSSRVVASALIAVVAIVAALALPRARESGGGAKPRANSSGSSRDAFEEELKNAFRSIPKGLESPAYKVERKFEGGLFDEDGDEATYPIPGTPGDQVDDETERCAQQCVDLGRIADGL